MTDTHAHIFLPDYSEDAISMINRALDVGIHRILMPSINSDSVAQMESISQLSSGIKGINLYPMIGLHPCEVQEHVSTWGQYDWKKKLESWLYTYASLDQYVGIGETGLDYYWSDEHKKEQMLSLDIHFELAKVPRNPLSYTIEKVHRTYYRL